MKKIMFGLLVLMLLIPKTVFGEDYVYYVPVSGYVYDANDKPLFGVQVSTKDNYTNYDTDTVDGYYSLLLPAFQKYTLKYEKQGYETQTKEIEISDEDLYLNLERVTMVATTDGTIVGTWKGNYTIPNWSYSTDCTIQLEQNGNNITGDATTSGGCRGTLTGTIDESILTFKVKGQKSGVCCKSNWEGTAIITCSQDYMVMTFTIKDKCNGKTVGSGEFWKQ